MSKANSFNLQCAATGLYLCDATNHFDVIAITQKPEKAFSLPTAEAAESARKLMRAIYGSFDWQAVPAGV